MSGIFVFFTTAPFVEDQLPQSVRTCCVPREHLLCGGEAAAQMFMDCLPVQTDMRELILCERY